MNTPEQIIPLYDSYNIVIAILLKSGENVMVLDVRTLSQIENLVRATNPVEADVKTLNPTMDAAKETTAKTYAHRFKKQIISSGETWSDTEDWALVSAVRQAQAENLFGRSDRKRLWIEMARSVLKERTKDAIASRYRKLHLEGKFAKIAAAMPPIGSPENSNGYVSH